MTRNKDYFRSIDETITDKVRFGDDSRIDIKGNFLSCSSVNMVCKNSWRTSTSYLN